MKDGKPEVLIIGESHPQAIVATYLPEKRLSGNVVVPDVEKARPHKTIEVTRIASEIIDAEIELIKDFGAKRLLFEHSLIRITRRAAQHLRKTHDLLKFQENIKLLDAKITKDQETHFIKLFRKLSHTKVTARENFFFSQPQHKWLSFFVARSGIYDINFFDDHETSLNDRCYFHILHFIKAHPEVRNKHPFAEHFFRKLLDDNNSKRETKMITNIRKNLVDKTVIICGEVHMRSIFSGLKKVAHLEPPAYFELPNLH